MSYAHLLPILVKVGAIVPKQTELAKLPYDRKHNPHATCGYHAGYVGNSTKVCHTLKTKVQELIDRNLSCFTPVTAKVLIGKEFEYKGPLIHVHVPPLMVQPAMQHPNQGHPPGIPLAYPGALSSTPVAPQHAQAGAPYVTFGIHHGQTSHQTVNPGLRHSAQMFQPMVIPPMQPLL